MQTVSQISNRYNTLFARLNSLKEEREALPNLAGASSKRNELTTEIEKVAFGLCEVRAVLGWWANEPIQITKGQQTIAKY